MEYVLLSSNGDVHRITIIPARQSEQGAYRLSDLAREGWSCPTCKEALVLKPVIEIYAKDQLQEEAIETAYAHVEAASHAQNEYAEVAPGHLNFGPLGLALSKTLRVLITNNRSQSLTWSADTGGADWLRLDQLSGAVEPYSQQIVKVTAKTDSLNVGHHFATLNFVLSNAVKVRISASVDVFKVEMIVTSHIGPKVPTIDKMEPSLPLTLPQGQQKSLSVTFTDHNTSTEMKPDTQLTWNATISGGGTWLKPASQKGTITLSPNPGVQKTLKLTIDASTLPKGTHNATLSLTVTSKSWGTSPQADLPIQVTVQ